MVNDDGTDAAASKVRIKRSGVVTSAGEALRGALADPSPSVRIIAAEALAMHGADGDAKRACETLLAAADGRAHGVYVSLLALNSLDELDERARGVVGGIRQLPRQFPGVPGRMKNNVPRLLEKILADLEDL